MVNKMNNNRVIRGIHHITAISGSAEENVAFYEKVLGLRLVKQTVNFDDPSTYHLYYGDHEGSPGTILTFFPWQGIPRGKNGAGMVTAVAFNIAPGSLGYWKKVLQSNNIETTTEQRFGEEVVKFRDPSGLELELIESAEIAETSQLARDGLVREDTILGFHSATSTLQSLLKTENLLVKTLGMVVDGQEGNRYRFKMENNTSRGLFYDLIIDPKAEVGRQGSGSVHHIAFRTPDDKKQLFWQRALRSGGYNVTEVRDRKYFKSIYFHEPGGVLFEIATDPPGFTVDESIDSLGGSLQLPDEYQPLRSRIERSLPPLRSAPFIHKYIEPQRDNNDLTIVALHGTGGDEHDLIPLAQQIGHGSAIISPRGRVKEGQWNRFFARFSTGAFDEKDLIFQSQTLADFVLDTARRHNRPIDHLVALGYSNGANIAAATLLLRPEVFSRLILLRPMMPLRHPDPVDLTGKEVLIIRGTADSVIPTRSTDQLIEILRANGAQVDVKKLETGHELTPLDLQMASQWLGTIARPDFAA